MSKPKLVSETVLPWLRDNCGKGCLAPLTGTDARALRAAVQIIELWSVDRDPRVLQAFGIVVHRMQAKCWYLAYHAIAHVVDWSDRATVWEAANLPPIAPGKADYEPGGAMRS